MWQFILTLENVTFLIMYSVYVKSDDVLAAFEFRRMQEVAIEAYFKSEFRLVQLF